VTPEILVSIGRFFVALLPLDITSHQMFRDSWRLSVHQSESLFHNIDKPSVKIILTLIGSCRNRDQCQIPPVSCTNDRTVSL
jgi:hypothetical protein